MAARPKPIAFVCVVRFATPQARNAFYATSGQAGQGAEAQARKMLTALGICDVELVTWVLPRAKAAKAAGAAAVAGPAVKAEAKAQSNNGSSSSLPGQAHLPAHLRRNKDVLARVPPSVHPGSRRV